MNIDGIGALVTGGASGLGKATAQRLLSLGAKVTIVDLPTSGGQGVADAMGSNATFFAADVTDGEQMQAAVEMAGKFAPLRATVHCAGRGHTMRVLDREEQPGSLEAFAGVIQTNLIGSFNVLRLSAAAMARNEPAEEDRGVIIMTASVAAFEGQIGQIPYASSKAGIVGMTIVAATRPGVQGDPGLHDCAGNFRYAAPRAPFGRCACIARAFGAAPVAPWESRKNSRLWQPRSSRTLY
jgi:NAD(P)-dependent dehydrogenase (short-subunit alcohol dehydrogenase family)